MTKYATRIALVTLLIGTGLTAGFAQAHQVPATSPHPTLTPVPVGQEAPFGYPVAPTAERSITVDKNTRYLNVVRLETVTIIAGGKSVTWAFDTLNTRSFSLAKIFPGFDDITVYVSESPLYRN